MHIMSGFESFQINTLISSHTVDYSGSMNNSPILVANHVVIEYIMELIILVNFN